MTVKELKLYSTSGGKIYQDQADAESFQKKEDLEFDYQNLPIFLYITFQFDYPQAKEALDSGKFLNDLKELEDLYIKIYQGKALPDKKILTPKKMGFYDRIASAIYLIITGKHSVTVQDI